MSLFMKIVLAVAASAAMMACSSIRHTEESNDDIAVVAAPGGKKIDYTYALNGNRVFSYSVRFVEPDPTSEWSPAMWFILEHKDEPSAYQFMLFQGIDTSVRPQIRLMDLAEQRERKSVEPDFQVPVTSRILVELEIEGNKVTSSINGNVVDTTELTFPIDQLRVGFSSGTFSIAPELPGLPAVGG